MSDSESDLRPRKKRERSANSILQGYFNGGQNFFFLVFFFFSFRRIKEKIKEKIEKDNKE